MLVHILFLLPSNDQIAQRDMDCLQGQMCTRDIRPVHIFMIYSPWAQTLSTRTRRLSAFASQLSLGLRVQAFTIRRSAGILDRFPQTDIGFLLNGRRPYRPSRRETSRNVWIISGLGISSPRLTILRRATQRTARVGWNAGWHAAAGGWVDRG
jgi:hypothetical protein